MDYRFLGSTGLKVSELCLGAMTFGAEADERSSHQMLDAFTAAGGTFIDTSDAYSAGGSEEILGRWLQRQTRDDVIIATKVRWGRSGGNDEGLSRKHIIKAVEASLRRLGTDYIDLYQVHAWDGGTPLTESLSTLDLLVRGGKVRYLGASNHSGWQLQKAIDLSQQRGWEPFSCLQPLYNLLDREAEWELIPASEEAGLGLIPWSPLRAGWLSGRYHRGLDAPPPDSRIAAAEERNLPQKWTNYANDRTWRVLDEVFAVAEETGRTPAQVSLRWLLQRPVVTAPIIGARTLAQLTDNLGTTGWALTEDQVMRLTAASDLDRLPYPYNNSSRYSRQ